MKRIALILIAGFSMLFSSGNISGVTYFEYEDSFDISRTYFTYKNTVSDELSFKFQVDVGQLDDVKDASDPVNDLNNDDRWTVYLKKAHMDWKVNSDMKMSMGMIGLNMFNVQEKTWGHRFLYKSAMDKYKFSKSADLGIAFTQKMGSITASLLMTNGEGYKESDVDDENKMSFQLLYGPSKLNKKDGYNFGIVYSSLEDVTVTGFFGGWASNGLRVGLEQNTEDDNGTENALTSIYATYKVNNNLSAVVRMDDIDSNSDGDAEEVTMAGLIWTPTKGLDICLNRTSVTVNDDADDTTKLNFQFKF
tara:strand:- start:289 stop:1206 length:918 start_codon:yes stop_codon:yes gene_type:complete